MKRLYSLFWLLLTAFVAQGQTVLLTENFDYTAGDSIRANGWTSHSNPGLNTILVTNPGLSWSLTPYAANNIGNAAGVNNSGSDENRNFSSYPTSGDVFISFLTKVRVPLTDLFFLHTGEYSNTSTPDFTSVSTAFRARTFAVPGATADKFRFGLSFNTNAVGSNTTAELDTAKTYLVVLKYRFIAGLANDQVSLYVFEDGANIAIEPSTPTIGPLTGSAADATVLQYVALRQQNSSQRVTVDGIIAQTTWNMLPTNTWNGTAWSAGQAPNRENAVINGNLTLNSSIAAGNVTINASNTVVLSAGNNLTIQGNFVNNGQLQLGANTLTITGTYSGSGTIQSNGGTIVINGDSTLGALSFDQTTDGTTNVLANLTINRSNNGTASLANKLNLTGTLTLTAGTLQTGGHLHLKSTSATASAQVIGGTNANISGNVVVERFLPWAAANNNGFRFVGHPLRNNPAFNTVSNLPTATNTLILYNESANAYVGIADRSQTWTQGLGYGVWTNAANTVAFTGELQLSDVSSISMSNANQRYNLVANPFASVLDWDAVSQTNMENAVWTWVKDNTAEGSGAWASYVNGVGANGGTRFLAPMQGFMVRAESSGSPALSFPATARVSGQTPTYNRTASLGDIYRIRVQNLANNSSLETVLRFHDLGADNFDGAYDAGFLTDFVNSSPDMYTTDAAGQKYSINSLPLLGADPVIIPLQIETFGPGSFSLHFDASAFTASAQVQLEDLRLGSFTTLNHGQAVHFTAGPNDASNRFRLHFNSTGAATSVNNQQNDLIQIYTNEGALYIRGIEQAQSLRILDISGRTVYLQQQLSLDGNALRPNLAKGTYVVQLVSGASVKTVKVIF
ncbi:MAG: T9SS type A sorting domain-containing protein [Sphingobacteriaceae bacterium]|nr:T9SS type A sorting domain-containing protein [Sphingobacteriaceae bacterium]